MSKFENLKHHWGTALIACLSLGMSACANLGLQSPGAVQEVYAAAEGADQTAYATIAVYNAVLAQAVESCGIETVPLEACAAFGEVTSRVSPSVAASAELWGQSLFYRELISDYRASGQLVPENILDLAAQAFAAASADWQTVRPAIEGAIAAGRGLAAN